MRRQFVSIIIAVALSLVSLVGCGSTAVSDTKPPEQAATPAVSEKPAEAPGAPTQTQQHGAQAQAQQVGDLIGERAPPILHPAADDHPGDERCGDESDDDAE